MGNRSVCDIGIASFDCFPELEACLESIFFMEKGALGRVLVVENSKRAIPAWIREKFPEVVWEKSRENIGFARACNHIISQSSSPYLLLLNPDTVIIKGFVEEAVKWMEAHGDVAVVAPKILDGDGTIQASARSFPGLDTAFFGRSSLITRLFPGNRVSSRNLLTISGSDEPVEADWVSGACMMVRRKAIKEVGLLDEGFFMYWEDCDWCTRFRKAGWKIYYQPKFGPLRHLAGSSSRKALLLTHFHFHKSAARLYIKYDSTPLHAGTVLAVSGALCRFLLLLPAVLLKQCR